MGEKQDGWMISHAEIEAANEHIQTCDSKYEFIVDGRGIRCACGWTFEAGDQHKEMEEEIKKAVEKERQPLSYSLDERQLDKLRRIVEKRGG